MTVIIKAAGEITGKPKQLFKAVGLESARAAFPVNKAVKIHGQAGIQYVFTGGKYIKCIAAYAKAAPAVSQLIISPACFVSYQRGSCDHCTKCNACACCIQSTVHFQCREDIGEEIVSPDILISVEERVQIREHTVSAHFHTALQREIEEIRCHALRCSFKILYLDTDIFPGCVERRNCIKQQV